MDTPTPPHRVEMPDYLFNDGAAIARPAPKPPADDEQAPPPDEPRPEGTHHAKEEAHADSD
jgi:hypothetical protein